MRRPAVILAAAAGAVAMFAIPSPALAETDCTYASGQAVSETVPVGSGSVTVYAGGGVTGDATAAAGACADPSGFSDGYVGVSNWEDGATRTDSAQCSATGPDNGSAGSTNSGGCVGADVGGWVYVPGDIPTPACGNTSGNAWDGSGNTGGNKRDGCSIP